METDNWIPLPTYDGPPDPAFSWPNFFNPLSLIPNLSGALSAMKTFAQAQAQAAVGAAVNGIGNAIMANSGASPLASAVKLGKYVETLRYDDPVGGEIDTFHNRLCFDSVCKHDPEMTNDLNTEWLRRAVFMRDDGSAPNAPEQQHSTHLLFKRPHQRFFLVPYQDATKRLGECKTLVHMNAKNDNDDSHAIKAVSAFFLSENAAKFI